MKVFLGGTVADSKWRDYVMPRLRVKYYNPIVSVWNEEAYQRELFEREYCEFCLYVLTPRLEGHYAIAEVIDDSFKRPDRTIYCYLKKDEDKEFTLDQLEDFERIGKLVRNNGGIWLRDLDEIIDYLNSANTRIKEDSSDKLFDVFISYGRRHSLDFANKLHHQLVSKGYSVWFDMNNIPLGVDFQEQIDDGIKRADNFVFIISPHSVKSIYCRKEIELAIKYQKRIIPLLHVFPDDCEDKMHPVIQKINWTPFVAEDGFQKSFEGLTDLLNSHKSYVREHTVLLNKALEWTDNQRMNISLLVGNQRADAEKWLQQRRFYDYGGHEVLTPCRPTELHCEYICESIKNAYNLMTEVFLCSESKDEVMEEKIRTSLNRFGITSWQQPLSIGSEALSQPVKTGIEQANNFIYLLSDSSRTSAKCIARLRYATSLNKRVFLLLTEPLTGDPDVTLRNLQVIDFSRNMEKEMPSDFDLDMIKYEVMLRTEKSDYEKDVDALVRALNQDKLYHEQHKVILAKAIKWNSQKRSDSMLLRGYNLENAKAWHRIAQQHAYKPTPLHAEFIRESEDKIGLLSSDVFISYSRRDSDFARKLNESIQVAGKTTWFDQESIASSVEFEQEILRGIETAHNFVFVITPDAVLSSFCAVEVAKAVELKKRIITILFRSTEVEIIPPDLQKVQWIDFSQRDFSVCFAELLRQLDLDRAHVEQHTRISQIALEWEKSQEDASLLLAGSQLERGLEWLFAAYKVEPSDIFLYDKELANKPAHKIPAPSKLLIDFLRTSKREADETLHKQLQQRKTRRLAVGFFVAFVLALVLGVGAVFERQKAHQLMENAYDILVLIAGIEKTNNSDINYSDLFKDKGVKQFYKAEYQDALFQFKIAYKSPDAQDTTLLLKWIQKADSCVRLRNLAAAAFNADKPEATAYYTQLLRLNLFDSLALLRTVRFSDEMASIPSGDLWRQDPKSRTSSTHLVSIGAFKLSKYEVTNLLFAAFLNQYGIEYVRSGEFNGKPLWSADLEKSLKKETSPIKERMFYWVPIAGEENQPATGMTWYGAYEFCNFLDVRLPTEAEWEFAAKAATQFEFSGSSEIDKVAWYKANSGGKKHEVGSLAPNAYGIYDMSGNVAEWCSDWFSDSLAIIDPTEKKVIRGGHYNHGGNSVKITWRFSYEPEKAYAFVGFRFAK